MTEHRSQGTYSNLHVFKSDALSRKELWLVGESLDSPEVCRHSKEADVVREACYFKVKRQGQIERVKRTTRRSLSLAIQLHLGCYSGGRLAVSLYIPDIKGVPRTWRIWGAGGAGTDSWMGSRRDSEERLWGRDVTLLFGLLKPPPCWLQASLGAPIPQPSSLTQIRSTHLPCLRTLEVWDHPKSLTSINI